MATIATSVRDWSDQRKKAVGWIGSLALGLAFWEILAQLDGSTLLPGLFEVARAFGGILIDSTTYDHLAASVSIVALGYLFSVALALPTALVSVKYVWFARLALPGHEFIRYIPVPAFVPLAAAIVGIGDPTKVLLIFIGTYFQLIFLFVVDFKSVPMNIEDSARTLGLRSWRLMKRVTIPAALPALLDTGRVTFAWAWSYLLVAEVVNAKKGIGYLVLRSYRALEMDRLVALLIVIGLFGVAVDQLFRWMRARACPWVEGDWK